MSDSIDFNRDAVIRRIKTALERRSGKRWSVTGGRGTAWGWLTIDAPPGRRTWSNRLKANASPCHMPEDYEEYDSGQPGGHSSPADRAELGKLLGFDNPVHCQGQQVPASHDHYREFIERAEGRPVTEVAKPYWD